MGVMEKGWIDPGGTLPKELPGNIVALKPAESLEERIVRVNSEIALRKTALSTSYITLLAHIKNKDITKEQLLKLRIYLGSRMQHSMEQDLLEREKSLGKEYWCNTDEFVTSTDPLRVMIQKKINEIMSMVTIWFPESWKGYTKNPELANTPLPEFLKKTWIIIHDRSFKELQALIELISLMIVNTNITLSETNQKNEEIIAQE